MDDGMVLWLRAWITSIAAVARRGIAPSQCSLWAQTLDVDQSLLRGSW
jgi:hypothetical protein